MKSLRLILKRILPRKPYNQLFLLVKKPFPMNLSDRERERKLSRLYQRKTGKTLDFSNLQLFTEKIQWYKLYYGNSELSSIVCKYHFKQYIEKRLGPGFTVPIIGAWTSVDEIPWDKLPSAFVLKSNCQSDSKFIMFIRNKEGVSFDEIKAELRKWINKKNVLVNSYCRAYYDVTPMILAEEYVEQIAGQVYDYKFFCFDGKPEFYKIDYDRFNGHCANYYTGSHQYIPWGEQIFNSDPNFDPGVPTEKLDEMLKIAAMLSTGFPFVRVDFFYYDGQIKVSEMTFYPGGGFVKVSEPLDREMGNLLNLPQKSRLGHKYRLDLKYD